MIVRWPWDFGHCMKQMLLTGRKRGQVACSASLHKELAAFNWSGAGMARGCMIRVCHLNREIRHEERYRHADDYVTE